VQGGHSTAELPAHYNNLPGIEFNFNGHLTNK
jgi:hypothetical protein